MRKFGLATVGAFALTQSCCTPEPRETREVTTEPAAQSAPATPPHHCEIVRESVRQKVLSAVAFPNPEGGWARYASSEANQEADHCYEEERMRDDCRGVRDRVLETARIFLDGRVFSTPHPQDAEESCLAGSGLAPEEEETFASR